ncbi:MAG: hypothetical protein Q9221_007964 [Calogaya cf. arnoldii]
MEGLAALSVVANIIQLTDATAKAFNVCHQVYTQGASINDARMMKTSAELSQAYTALNDSLRPDTKPSHTYSSSGVDLTSLGLRCCKSATALNNELQSLNKSPGGGFRKTVSGLFLKARKAERIHQLKHSLDEYQKVFNSKLLIDIRETLGNLRAEHHQDTTRLKQQLSELSTTLSQIPVLEQLRSEIDRALAISEAQHAITRQHAETQIASVMQSLEISQDRFRSEQSQAQQSQRRFDQFLESLWFSDMNLRANDVSASYPATFEWMFDATAERPWSSFTKWLKGSDPMYWVQSKAGPGKSTLMKFIANDPRTKDLLGQSSPDNKTLIANFYFWLSGSKLQRSLKGLLCSLSRQIMLEDSTIFDSISTEKRVLMKRSIHDWSDEELQRLLTRLVNLSSSPICMFLDGLDEFDQGDSMDNLIDLIETLSLHDTVKLCVSSRPENQIAKRLAKYSHIRLQDLTADDIHICIRDSLQHARTRCSPSAVDDDRVDEIVRIMYRKAEGVFLWVHYALSSVMKGMSNDDSFTLQGGYLEDLKPRTATELLSRCQRLSNRIRTVCAGLLEVTEPDHYRRSLCGLAVDPAVEDADSPVTNTLTDEDWYSLTLSDPDIFMVQFLHRTARDFLLETTEGHVISGQSCPFPEEQDIPEVILTLDLNYKRETFGFRPSSEDSMYLGEALNDILMWDKTSSSSLDSLAKVSEARRAEVHKRSQRLIYQKWVADVGYKVDESLLTEHTLDPAEEVDGSNWREKGHFKKPIEILDSQSAELGATE